MKKIINDPNRVVSDMLRGLAVANPDVEYFPEAEVVALKEKSGKVGLITGGGSGHEPSFAGYVGKGMLTAAIAGNVFASPSPDRIIKGFEAADSGKGVLAVIMNYSGDLMNFDMAKEMVEMEGIETRIVIVKDDVAVPDREDSTGRRGIAGTVLVHKVAGAKAAAGASLEEVAAVAQKAADNVRTMGMSMSSCTIPAVGKPGFSLGENEIEIGMGIHGEPGLERTGVKTAKELASALIERILADYDYSGSQVAVLVNGLGATPLMELNILTGEVDDLLKEKGITPYRYFVGNYMTSLEMAGCSITLMKLDDELKELIDAPCEAPSFRI